MVTDPQYCNSRLTRGVGTATAVIVIALYFGTGVFDHEIWSPAEPAFAGVVWTMFRGGSLAVPRIHDFYYLEKPPLSYWLGWLSCKAVGKLDAGCLRFPTAVLGVLCLCLVYWIANKRNGTWIACITVFFTATSVEFYHSTHLAGSQPVAVFFVFLCFALFLRTLLKGDGADAKCDLAFLAALAVSFYAKNFFTFLIVLPPVILFLLLKRKFRRAAQSVILVMVFTAVAIAPWVFAIYNEGGLHYLRVVFFDNTFGRFFNFSHLERFTFGPLDDAFTVARGDPRYIYLLALFRRAAPWSLVFVAALIWLFRHRGVDNFKFFLKVTIISVPVLLTFSASRPQSYIDPLLFIMLLIVGEFLRDLFFIAGSVTRFERALFNINLAVVAAAVTIAPIVLGIYFGKPTFFGLSLLIGLAFAVLAWRFRGAYRGPPFAYGITCLVALSAFVMIMAVMPSFDALKSQAVFFDEIRDQIAGREVYTTVLDDRRLPLITYYLNWRVPIVQDRERILQLLKGEAKVGVIFARADYLKAEKYLDQIPHKVISPSHGSKVFVLVNNL